MSVKREFFRLPGWSWRETRGDYKKPSLDYTLPHWLWMPSFQTVDHLQGSGNILRFYIEQSGEIALPRLCGAASHHTVRR